MQMKLFELEDGSFYLVKANGETSFIKDPEELEIHFGFNKSFELLLNSINIKEIMNCEETR